eukprot:CAMPEP_0201722522 /NCGR_PEP_ID=MMETSP0593-20130828/6885_1 /ASSEMBLY_ACC=CAM_ASM_000672 /TAXON_ID=267983 /ORGANISM="Skeletonema japonicum, Strain CCMP2506" /LENGTH=270 /DNA_ID=CAMNT_0048213499 /DNA_START=126 /DNA_END=938 /DNA_ORIENTATION=-
MLSSSLFIPSTVLLLSSMSAAFQTQLQPRLMKTSLNLSPAEKMGDNQQESYLSSRRNVLTQSIAAAGAAALFPLVSVADDSSTLKLEPYVDSDYNFKLSVPSSFTSTQQKLSGRRKAVFFTDEDSKDGSGNIDTLGFIAYTPMRDDFTTLSSFGSVDEVGQSTILPKSELAGNKEDSKMLSAVSKNNAYFFDYVAKPIVPTDPGSSAAKSGQMTKELEPVHFRTIFTLLPLKDVNVAGLTLVTITFQTTEAKYSGLKSTFDEIILSYGKA